MTREMLGVISESIRELDDVLIPEGYRVVETDERVGLLGGRLTRRGAERLRDEHPPMHAGLRYEIEKAGGLRWDRWRVVAFQNLLEKVDGS